MKWTAVPLSGLVPVLGTGARGRGHWEGWSCKVQWQVSQNLDWRFCLAQQMSPREKTSTRLVLILTPNDLSQTCKNYSYYRTVRIIICLQSRQVSPILSSMAFSPHPLRKCTPGSCQQPAPCCGPWPPATAQEILCIASFLQRQRFSIFMAVPSESLGPSKLLSCCYSADTGSLSGHPCQQRVSQCSLWPRAHRDGLDSQKLPSYFLPTLHGKRV